MKRRKANIFSISKAKRYRFPTHINDLIIDRKHTERAEAMLVVLGPDEKPPRHVHSDMEQIFYVISGRGLLSLGKNGRRKLIVKKNQVVYIPRNEHHSILNLGQREMRYLAIDIFPRKPRGEPTWDSHVRVMCNRFGWDPGKIKKA